MKNQVQNLFTVNEQLELFLTRADELRETQLIKKGFKSSFSFGSNRIENSFKVSGFEPDEDDLRSFLTIYRKFISNDSPVFMNKIFNICQLYLKDEQIKSNLIQARQHWNDEFTKGFMNLNINQKKYTPEEIMDLWINAVYFHDDLEKIKLLENIMSNIFFYTIIRQIFFSLINETTRQIFYVSNSISFGLKNFLFEFNKTK